MYPYKTPTSPTQSWLPDNTSGDPIMNTSNLRQYNLTTSPTGYSVVFRGLELLKPYLPTCLPLYRRLQFGRFFDDTVLFTNLDCQDPEYERKHFLAAFVDRSCRPETEVWMFGSWEVEGANVQEWARVKGMVGELVEAVKGLGVRRSIHKNGDGVLTPPACQDESDVQDTDAIGLSRNDYASHASDPNIVLWGAVHERTVAMLKELGFVSTAYDTTLVPNSTFIFKLDELPEVRPLPAGLKWSTVDPKDFALVKSRTQIPRQDRTMAVLPSLAIRPVSQFTSTAQESQPVAWAFVGLDGSLTTLHVEEEWRGKGLAKAIAVKLFREKMHSFWEAGLEKMSHGYVVDGNVSSEATCRSLRGRCGWQSYWLRVDLSKVPGG